MRGGLVFLAALLLLVTTNPGSTHSEDTLSEDVALLDSLADRPHGDGDYTNEWAVKVPGGEELVKQLAAELEFKFRGQVSHFAILLIKSQVLTVPALR